MEVFVVPIHNKDIQVSPRGQEDLPGRCADLLKTLNGLIVQVKKTKVLQKKKIFYPR